VDLITAVDIFGTDELYRIGVGRMGAGGKDEVPVAIVFFATLRTKRRTLPWSTIPHAG